MSYDRVDKQNYRLDIKDILSTDTYSKTSTLPLFLELQEKTAERNRFVSQVADNTCIFRSIIHFHNVFIAIVRW